MDPLYDLSISSDDDLIERQIRRYRPRFNFEAETDEQIIDNFRYYPTGDHYQSLAQFFGVTKGSVSGVITRVTNALVRIAGEYI